MKVRSKILDCEGVQPLMSPFIDSMVTPDETARLLAHVDECEPCQRQLQSLISVRNLLADVSPVPEPADLVLETRVRLSHVRSRSRYDRWQARLKNFLKPLAVPAVTGVTVTLFFFAGLFGSLISETVVYADQLGGPAVATYQPIQTTAPLGAGASPELEQTLSIDTRVSGMGRPIDYRIISGTRSPDVDRWVREMMLLAQFRPATSFGVPVQSRIILSFVNVRA
jgi:hypothetical protein